MKKFKWLSLVLLIVLLVSACGGATPTAETPEEVEPEPGGEEQPPPEQEGPFRVAVVMPSAINDLAFSQSMYDALNAIEGEMGSENFDFDHSEGMFVVDDAAAALRDYASEGYNLVIAHGSQYGGSLQEIARMVHSTVVRCKKLHRIFRTPALPGEQQLTPLQGKALKTSMPMKLAPSRVVM